MKRILNITGGMAPGGVESFIMNVYRNVDREKVQFDFIVHKKVDGDFIPEIEAMGGKVFLAPRKSKHPFKNLKMIKDTVKAGNYAAVIRHSANAYCVLDLKAAKSGGAKKVIFHSHSTSTKLKTIHKFFRGMMKTVPTERFACSNNAGRWMYGDADFKVICNAIDIKKYAFNKEKQDELRKEFGLLGKKVFIHVGNLRAPKNHLFLISFFEKVVRNNSDAVLLLVGEGEERANIEAKISELGIEENVKLLGLRHDIPELLNMADVFFLPSVYEGLPVSVIEAQAAGLKCLISDVITEDVVVTDLVTRMSLDRSLEDWANQALELSKDYSRDNQEQIYSQISENGYDVKKLALFYENL